MKKILPALTYVVFVIPAIYLLMVWNTLPEKVPMHYNMQGEITRYGNKSELILAIAILAGVNIGVYLLLKNVHRFGPKKYTEADKERMLRISFGINIFISAIICLLVFSSANSATRFMPGIILSCIGLLFSFIGNYLYNIKPNYFAGFRVPWTLNDEDIWRKTHHLAGKLWFVGGLVVAIICLILPFKANLFAFIAVTAMILIIPGVYSYRLYRQKKISH